MNVSVDLIIRYFTLNLLFRTLKLLKVRARGRSLVRVRTIRRRSQRTSCRDKPARRSGRSWARRASRSGSSTARATRSTWTCRRRARTGVVCAGRISGAALWTRSRSTWPSACRSTPRALPSSPPPCPTSTPSQVLALRSRPLNAGASRRVAAKVLPTVRALLSAGTRTLIRMKRTSLSLLNILVVFITIDEHTRWAYTFTLSASVTFFSMLTESVLLYGRAVYRTRGARALIKSSIHGNSN